MCLCEYEVHVFLYANEAVTKQIEIQIDFCLHHLNLKGKRNTFLYHLAHVQESFIIYKVFYSFIFKSNMQKISEEEIWNSEYKCVLPALQIRVCQQSITANIWPLITHIHHIMIIVTGGISKKSFFIIFRSSCLQMFFKTSVIRNFAIFTEKHVLESLFNKVIGLTTCNFISTSPQKRLQHRSFLWKLQNFYEQLLLLNISMEHFFYEAAFVSLIK